MPEPSPTLQSWTEFRRFRDRLDALTSEAAELYADKMQCRAGCSACCRGDFRISLIESLAVRHAVQALPEATRQAIRQNLEQPSPERCPLLLDQRCAIYAERPLLCRIFGFPITDGRTMATCELNFTGERMQDFSAKSFNQPVITDSLSLLSRLYLEEVGSPLPEGQDLPVFYLQEVLEAPPPG